MNRQRKTPAAVIEVLNQCIQLQPFVVVYRDEVNRVVLAARKMVEHLRSPTISRKGRDETYSTHFLEMYNGAMAINELLNNIREDTYKEIAFVWKVEKVMMDLMINMMKISNSLQRMGVPCENYMPTVEDLTHDFQALYGKFVNDSSDEHRRKLDSITRFMDAHKIQRIDVAGNGPIKDIFASVARNYRLEHNDFVVGDYLGGGNTSSVYMGTHKKTNKSVAIKQFKVEKFEGEDLVMYRREVSALASLKHANLVTFVGGTTSKPFWLVTELLPMQLHKVKRELNPAAKTIIAYQIADGMAYLHSKGMMHRDLKSQNVMLTKNYEAKIIDFGAAKLIQDQLNHSQGMGVLNYMAPEVAMGNEYAYPADVYSYGMILWELLTGSVPFDNVKAADILKEINQSKRPEIPKECPADLRELILLCWEHSEINRPTFKDIVQHMINDEISFPSNDDHEKQIIAQFYESKRVERGINVSEDVKSIVQQFDKVIEAIGNAVVYKHEIIRIRGFLHGYKQQILKSSIFTDPKMTLDMNVDLGNLSIAIEKLGDAISFLFEAKWVREAMKTPAVKFMDDLNDAMDEICMSLIHLGLNIVKYEPTRDDIEKDFNYLVEIFLENSRSPDIQKRLEEVTRYMDEHGMPHQVRASKHCDLSHIFREVSRYLLKHKDFEILSTIARGSSGTVELGINVKTNQQVAIKVFQTDGWNNYDVERLHREIRALSSYRHPNVIEFVGVTSTSPYWLVTKFMPGSSLFTRIRNGTQPDPTQMTKIIFQIAIGMEYLHENHIIHRDLKTLNILLDEEDDARICDFGISRPYEENTNMTGNLGTYNYMAPEVIRSSMYNLKADVFSFAMTTWECLSKEVPYDKMQPHKIVRSIISGIRPKLPEGISREFASLITSMWDGDDDKRPTFTEIVNTMIHYRIAFPGADVDAVNEFYVKHQNMRDKKVGTKGNMDKVNDDL